MSDTPVTSPTGEPVIPPAVFKWLALGVSLVLAVCGSLLAVFPDSKTLLITLSITTAVAAVLGITSPGLRKALVVLLVAGAVLTTSTGCALFKPALKADLQSCASSAVSAEVANVMPDVLIAIQGDAANWEGQLDKLIATAGQAALCALAALVRNIELGSGGAGFTLTPPERGGLPDSVMLIRGYAYLSKVAQ
jgi:hypothetical protein